MATRVAPKCQNEFCAEQRELTYDDTRHTPRHTKDLAAAGLATRTRRPQSDVKLMYAMVMTMGPRGNYRHELSCTTRY
jgi:hypothetical protein